MSSIVILGTGIAGYTLARELRKIDKETPITLITSDDGHNYSKPMLSAAFGKGKSAEDLSIQDSDTMARQLNATILTHTNVTSIQRTEQTITLESGDTLAYSKLIMALGAAPIRLPIPGGHQDEVLCVNDLMDYRKFRDTLPANGRAIIIGAGLIGCEFACDLRKGEHNVDVVAKGEHVMPELLPTEVADVIQGALTENGANFHMGNTITNLSKEGDEYVATLEDGQVLRGDLVLSAIGLRPRTELAKEAGIETARGIITDEFLQTSDENIYSVGDCSEVKGLNLLYILPLMAGARALAKTLTGTPTAVKYGPMPVTVKTPVCPLVVAPPARDAEGKWEIEINDRNIRALFTNGDDLLGYALTGETVSEKMKLSGRLPAILA